MGTRIRWTLLYEGHEIKLEYTIKIKLAEIFEAIKINFIA